jgi:large conductance mechanosensitive channel
VTKLANEFKLFILRGNVVSLAVAVVMALAFSAVVDAFIEDLITPLIAVVFGEPDFSALAFTINGSVFRYGDFLNAVFSFICIALVVFFLVIKPMNALMTRANIDLSEPGMRKCPECLKEIPEQANRCSYCTAEVGPARRIDWAA